MSHGCDEGMESSVVDLTATLDGARQPLLILRIAFTSVILSSPTYGVY